MRKLSKMLTFASVALALGCFSGSAFAFADGVTEGKDTMSQRAESFLSSVSVTEVFGEAYQDYYAMDDLDFSNMYLSDGVRVYSLSSEGVEESQCVFWPILSGAETVAFVVENPLDGIGATSTGAYFASAFGEFLDAEGTCAVVAEADQSGVAYYLVSDDAVALVVNDSSGWSLETKPELVEGLCSVVETSGIENPDLLTVQVIKGSAADQGEGAGLAYMSDRWITGNGKTVYVNKDADLSAGWEQVDSKWYYFDLDTNYMKTGWIKPGKVWYYLGADGVMQTGWTKVDGTWYYMNAKGAMQTGWVKPGKVWYYLASNGAMQTGWEKVNGKWYYLSSSGAMQTGWEKVNGQWYYLGSNGAMQTGWVKYKGTWYYLNTAKNAPMAGPQGAMVKSGTYRINGVYRTFNASGAWVA